MSASATRERPQFQRHEMCTCTKICGGVSPSAQSTSWRRKEEEAGNEGSSSGTDGARPGVHVPAPHADRSKHPGEPQVSSTSYVEYKDEPAKIAATAAATANRGEERRKERRGGSKGRDGSVKDKDGGGRAGGCADKTSRRRASEKGFCEHVPVRLGRRAWLYTHGGLLRKKGEQGAHLREEGGGRV